MNDKPWRLFLAGAGNVGGNVLRMLDERAGELEQRYGARLQVVGVAELGGAAVDLDGLDLAALRATLQAGTPLAGMPRVGRPGMTAMEALRCTGADVMLEAMPVDVRDGQPGLDTTRAALRDGVHVVLADKGPLALAYAELAALSDLADGWGSTVRTDVPAGRPRLRFSATVAGALPVVNLGCRDLAGSRLTRIEGVFNGTSHSILRAMECGVEFADALADAQRRGIAEADPTLDVDGHDAACKLVIAVNAVLGGGHTLADVAVHGIQDVTAERVRAAREAGGCLLLLCSAEIAGPDVRLSVAPGVVDRDHPLARLTPDEMGVVFYADGVDRLSAASLEPGPDPASAAMLRDLLDIIRSERWHST